MRVTLKNLIPFSIANDKICVKFSELKDILQVGVERKYGFGRLKLGKLSKEKDQDLGKFSFNGFWKEERDEIVLKLKNDSYIWAHTRYASDLKIKGNVELLTGREWSDRGAGRQLRSYGLYWTSGSVLPENRASKITKDFGIWEVW